MSPNTNRNRTKPQSRRTRIMVILSVIILALVIITYFMAASAGTDAGTQRARNEITSDSLGLTKGPKSLLME